MASLKINYDNLDDVSNKVIAKGEEFETLLTKIKNSNSSLQSAWIGTDSSAYTAKVEVQAEQMQKLAEAINEIGMFLQKVSNAYRETQEEIKSAIGE